MRKVGIIGLGHVGSTVALNIVQGGYADELVLIDKIEAKAIAEEGDLRDALSLLPYHVHVHVGNYEDLADADIVLSCLGHVELIEPSGDRFTELRANIPEIRQVAAELNRVGYKNLVLITTNPNDVIVELYAKALDLPREQVIGTGTYLDTARLKRQVADSLGMDARNISGYALGEHGASQFVAWSTIKVAGQPFTELAKARGINLEEIEQKTRVGGFTVFDAKGYTNVAIAAANVSLLNILLSDAKNIAICSHYDENLQSYISTPALLGRKGVEGLVELDLTAEERLKLQASVDEIQDKIERFSK